MDKYPKRLIEVDLPIKRISAHARREKSIRHGHISTLHIWWARRPLAACRAVICASLWPDPVDPLCPDTFRGTARSLMTKWATEHLDKASPESFGFFVNVGKNTSLLTDNLELRRALLNFIADFANWDNSTVREYLDTSRALTQAAHEALGGAPGTRPLVVDPFAGGGSIPLEALRVGADAFASDLNPVPVLLNKVVLEYIPKYGQRLVDEVRKWGEWIKREAEKELAEFYPKDANGATSIAYLWARTIQCEGPSCGAEVPLIRSLWLANKANRAVALQLMPNPKAKRVDFRIIVKKREGWIDQADSKIIIDNPKFDGTVKRGSATCPCCRYTTPVARVREQFMKRRGGANDARLLCVVTTMSGEQGRSYRLPIKTDYEAVQFAAEKLERNKITHEGTFSLVPNESLPPPGTLGFRVQRYGILEWGDLFSSRQLLSLTSLVRLLKEVSEHSKLSPKDEFTEAVRTCVAMVVNKLADKSSTLCRWKSSAEYMAGNTFSRQALPLVFDFCEANLLGGVTGDISAEVSWLTEMLSHVVNSNVSAGHAERCSATQHVLPDDAAHALITDPPYYDAVPYADLSDFFFVWFRRSLPGFDTDLQQTPKEDECIVDESRGKNKVYFERQMTRAMSEGRRVLSPSGIGVIVFAHKSTAGWEAQLQALLDAGWIMTGSWPIDTEMGSRLRAMDSAALASSVHLVCRPRENPDGSIRAEEIGDWRDILQELPRRIHEWMPRLAEEGVVGADAIFACLGPALEIFSRYSSVEKASGEKVALREYLEQVWAAVAREALNMIFAGADTSGFEEDARLTAMWLWTLATATTDSDGASEESDDTDGEENGEKKNGKISGYALEYDAARKIAQGLGIHLEDLTSLVTVQGDTAVLLPAAARTRYLFGKDSTQSEPTMKSKKKEKQIAFDFITELQQIEQETGSQWAGEFKGKLGKTILDQLHQSMILFAAGRGDALKRLLVDEGIGKNAFFWRLAQALSALYPSHSEEKRWVDGVLARKKGLGL